MRISHQPRLSTFATALALGALSLATSLVWAVPPVRAAAGPANVEASEFVRLINGVRGANGLGALQLDPYLAGLARDTPMTCPGDASLVMLGRARDGAENDYVSHYLRLCPTVKFVSILQTTYNYQNVGEIMLQNGGYGSAQYLVTYAGSSSTYQTYSYSTTGHGILGWMSSSTHAAIIVGAYDRVGCGGWLSAGGTFFYDCIFSMGGPNGTTAPPTKPPFADPVAAPQPTAVPTPAPTPVPTPAPTRPPRPTATSLPEATQLAIARATATEFATPSATASATTVVPPSIEPTESPAGVVRGIAGAAAAVGSTPPGGVAAAQLGGGSGGLTNHAPGIPPRLSRDIATAAGWAAGALCVVYALVLLRRRRRRGAPAS